MDDLISRQTAIDALWKSLFEYEDKTEKQFIESDELDVVDWIGHRIFAQNMNDIDRQTILTLPSAELEYKLDEWCEDCKEYDHEKHCCPRFNRVIRTALSEAESEQKTGKWLKVSPAGIYECSECGRAVMTGDIEAYKFCHGCGVRMEA